MRRPPKAIGSPLVKRAVQICCLGALALACNKAPPKAAALAEAVAAPAAPAVDSVFAAAFLKYLGSDLDASALGNAFDASKGGHWNADSVLSFLADTVTFFDINGERTWRASQAQLREELTTRHGASFVQLVHLGFTAAIPYPQYSTLTFTRGMDSSAFILGIELYRVRLAAPTTAPRVYRIEYLELRDQ